VGTEGEENSELAGGEGVAIKTSSAEVGKRWHLYSQCVA